MKFFILVLTYFCVCYSAVDCRLNTDDQYIVKLKTGTNATRFITRSLLISSNGDVVALNTLVKHVFRTVFSGFSVKLDKSELLSLQTNNEYASQIELIEKDELAKASNDTPVCDEWTTQLNAGWGLARVSAKNRLPNSGPYHYNYRNSAGEGVTVYVIDTGVYEQHNDLSGRAVTGVNYVPYENDNDYNGHGTHVCGTVAGSIYGIAKNTRIVAVKVLDEYGEGYMSWIISGIEWVIQNANTPRRSVINMSLGGTATALLDEAVRNAVNSGITVVVAAGNSGDNACQYSPAREPLAITVAASDILDNSAYFTSYGLCVDLYAPGLNITSSWIGTPNSALTISGTSMASPHVAGMAAYFISEFNTNNPSEVESLIKSYAIPNQLTGVPANTVNLLLNNNATTELCGFEPTEPTESNGCVAFKLDIFLAFLFVFTGLVSKI